MVWLIGNKGMLGSDVEAALRDHQLAYIASDLDTDITDINSLRGFASGKDIQWIINCSAYTAVDNAEDDPETAFNINADGVRNIASVSKEIDAVLIHISTDYVFNGTEDGEYHEDDSTGPTGVYGKSKLRGEEYIDEILEKFFIIRTSWLYGEKGNNFIKTMLRLFNERDEVSVVSDQWGSPTYTVDLALFLVEIIRMKSRNFGIYHFSSEGKINWHEFASYIYHKAGKLNLIDKEVVVKPIPTSGFPTKAERPENSYLSKEKVKKTFGFIIPGWEDSIDRYLNTMKRP